MIESRNLKNGNLQSYPRLLGDIGGTNARFGWQVAEHQIITNVQILPCAEYESLHAAANFYLASNNLNTPPSAAFGIATPVTSDSVAMTNHHWKFSINTLREGMGVSRLLLLNDFTALALSLPFLADTEKRQIGQGNASTNAAIGLIGPGTGLGVSGLLPASYINKWTPISGEGGHITLAATTEYEFAVIQNLQNRYGHVSAERVISGAGLVDLYLALCDLKYDQRHKIQTPAELIEHANSYPASIANEALDMFCGFLGSVAGDLALTIGARGGIYIGGGIVPRLGDRIETTPFRERFESKGRFKKYLQEVPTWVIQSEVSPALKGASHALSLSDY